MNLIVVLVDEAAVSDGGTLSVGDGGGSVCNCDNVSDALEQETDYLLGFNAGGTVSNMSESMLA